MSKIYTKTGDRGQTSLFDGTRVPKNHIRVETYGTIDELNSQLGIIVSQLQREGYQGKLREQLANIQEDLFTIGSFLANPAKVPTSEEKAYFETVILQFEKEIDHQTTEMETLSGFILPGGHVISAFLHVARTIARRSERRLIELWAAEPVDQLMIKYFNRLSDLLFSTARYVNFKENHKDVLWTKKIG